MYKVNLTVNGRIFKRRIQPRLFLSDFIRYEIGSTGMHIGLRKRRVRRLHASPRWAGEAILLHARRASRRPHRRDSGVARTSQ
jgi:hypothetical protein